MSSTQPLPSPDTAPTTAPLGTHPLSTLWRRTRPALALFAGGAALTFAVSGAMSRVISSETPPRALPTAKASAKPQRVSLEEWQRDNPSDASFLDRNARTEAPAPNASIDASVLPALANVPASPGVSDAAREVSESNADGTAWKDFVPQSEDDKRRIEGRRDEDRLLTERRALEAQKKRIERELEVKALQEKFRLEDKQAESEQREEDRRRIEGRVEEDRRQSEERQRSGQQLAEIPPQR
jgi:hypothetical protein